MSSTMRKPDWTPDDAGDAFATRIVAGVGGGHGERGGQSHRGGE